MNVALACEWTAPASLSINPNEQETDPVPPSQVVAALTVVEPGDGMEFEPGDGGGWCKGDAFAEIRILSAIDNWTNFDDLGFTVTVVAGRPPETLYTPQYPILSRKGSVVLMWLVGRQSRIAPVDFTVTIAATDTAGNEGPASEPIRIQHGWVDK
jgi:hypothetical protein